MQKNKQGFTIVELLIVIVVIAILAAITIVSYNGISARSKEAALKTDLKNGSTQIKLLKTETNTYPANSDGLKKSDTTTFTYSTSENGFCLAATSAQLPGKSFFVVNDSAIQEGECPPSIADGALIQTITSANCPTTRVRAVDSRDNRTYWVQKLADGRCWMLTNLAYAGGGSNTYGDSKALVNATGAESGVYSPANYYIPVSNSNVTTEPTAPSTATTGTSQYGYRYNWCAAMGGQTNSCTDTPVAAPDPTVSVCPAGWRLPTSNGGEFGALNTAVNNGSGSTDAGLRQNWLAQRGGYGYGSWGAEGIYGYYWSSTSWGVAAPSMTYIFAIQNTSASSISLSNKNNGYSVRCIAV